MANQPGLLTKALTILLAVGLAGAFIYYRKSELQSKVTDEEFVQPRNPDAAAGQTEQAANKRMLLGGTKSMVVMNDQQLQDFINTTATVHSETMPDARMTSEQSFYMMSSKSGAVFAPPQPKAKP